MGSYSIDKAALERYEMSEVVPTVERIGDDILAEALVYVPRDTESLADSGRVEVEHGATAAETVVSVRFGGPDYPYRGDPTGKKTVDYAKYQEMGTRHQSGQPFLRPAALHER
jgi:HK97 gp10 family phage protein